MGVLTWCYRINPSSWNPFNFCSITWTSLLCSSSLLIFSSSSSFFCYLEIDDAQGSVLDLLLNTLWEVLITFTSSHPCADGPKIYSSSSHDWVLDSNVSTSNSTLTSQTLMFPLGENTPLFVGCSSHLLIAILALKLKPNLSLLQIPLDHQILKIFMIFTPKMPANLVPSVHSLPWWKET